MPGASTKTEKVTVRIPVELIARLRAAVAAGDSLGRMIVEAIERGLVVPASAPGIPANGENPRSVRGRATAERSYAAAAPKRARVPGCAGSWFDHS